MKARILTSLSTTITFSTDEAACTRQIARLRELGAPDALIASAEARNAAMREELPRLFTFIQTTIKASASCAAIIQAAGAAGFTPEALYAIRPD